ncbi:MAG: SurA N-terminal domain-containing protein [Anaerolineae bacterium]|nr:SurA N-terminal domain-containing protein [Anaerolineae bacterium]MCX8066924.1 SurA N-terminal domain-containing protein [Anaerolineae bacterium]MDW7991178.1 SurA N-terminal domain-containing protein [Anaerolineae bacterium]
MSKKRREVAPRPLTKKQQSRAEREARMNRWLIIGTVAVCILVLAVVGYGLLDHFVLKAREPVAIVNGIPISAADFEARVRYHRSILKEEQAYLTAQRMAIDPTDPDSSSILEYLNTQIRQLDTQLSPAYATFLGKEILDQMIREELIRQEAARRGITVSQEEIDRAIEEQFGYDRDAAALSLTPTAAPSVSPTVEVTATATPAPTPMPREEFERLYREFVNNRLKPAGLSEKKFRAMVEASLLYDKLQEAFAAELPPKMEQVQFRHMSFSSEEAAKKALERLEKGEKWEDIAAEIQENTEDGAYAVDAQWGTQGYLEDLFGETAAATVWSTQNGQYTQPIAAEDGRWYIVQVLGREERELDFWLKLTEQQRRFQAWLDAQMAQVQYSDNWQEKVPTQP